MIHFAQFTQPCDPQTTRVLGWAIIFIPFGAANVLKKSSFKLGFQQPHNPKKSSWNLLRALNIMNLKVFFADFWLTVVVTTASPKISKENSYLQYLKRSSYGSNCSF